MEHGCLECGSPIMGRADKKFCSDQCRSSYNNKLKSGEENYLKKVNKILRTNRNILKSLNPEGKVRIKKERMQEQGYNFNFMTSQYTNQKGQTYHFCYEYGFLPLDDGSCVLVKRNEDDAVG